MLQQLCREWNAPDVIWTDNWWGLFLRNWNSAQLATCNGSRHVAKPLLLRSNISANLVFFFSPQGFMESGVQRGRWSSRVHPSTTSSSSQRPSQWQSREVLFLWPVHPIAGGSQPGVSFQIIFWINLILLRKRDRVSVFVPKVTEPWSRKGRKHN